MVFGWGKKKEEPSAYPEKQQINMSDIQKIIDDILSRRTSQMLNEISSLRDNTSPLIKELIKIGQSLEKDNLDVDEIDKHLRIIVVRGKKQVIDVIKKDASELPRISNFDDAVEFNNTLTQILKKIGDVLGRQTRVIHIFAKKYAEQLKYILAQMNSNHSELKQLIINYERTKTLHAEIVDSIKIISTNDDELHHYKQRIIDLTSEINSIKNQTISLQESISKIKSSKEYVDYLLLQKSLEQIISEKPLIKNQIASQFTKISRPLSRYEYISSDKKQKMLLTKLLEDPIDVLVSKNKDSVIVILENVRKGILSGTISVKDVEKSMAQITETVEMLDSFIKQVDEFKNKLYAVKQQMNQFDTNILNKLEKDLEKTLHENETHLQKITDFENEINNIGSSAPKLLSELESKLREFSNIQYTIVKSS